MHILGSLLQEKIVCVSVLRRTCLHLLSYVASLELPLRIDTDLILQLTDMQSCRMDRFPSIMRDWSGFQVKTQKPFCLEECHQRCPLHLWEAFGSLLKGGIFAMWQRLEGQPVLDCVWRWSAACETGDWVSCWRLCSQQVLQGWSHDGGREMWSCLLLIRAAAF